MSGGLSNIRAAIDQSSRSPGYTIPEGFVGGGGLFSGIAGAQPSQPSMDALQPLQMYQSYQQGTPINQLNNPTTPRPAQYLPSQYIGGTPAPGAK